MKQLGLICSVLIITVLLGAAGCGGDPNVEGAKLALTQDEVDYADYYSKLDESIAADPTNAEAHYVKGRLMKRQLGEVRDADERSMLLGKMVGAFNSALEIEPDNSEIMQEVTNAYIEEFRSGYNAFQRGQEDENAYAVAVQHFQNASMIRPDSLSPYVNQAYALFQAGSATEAIMPLEKAIGLGEENVDTYTFLSSIYQTENRMEDSIDLLLKAREMHPGSEEIRGQLLNAYIATDQIDRAMDDYSSAVDSEPDNKIYRYNYGTLLMGADMYDEAIEQLTAAVEIDPEYGDAYANIGAAYANKAISVHNSAIELDDKVRTDRSSMSSAQIEEAEKKIEMLIDERKMLFGEAVTPLKRAREIKMANGDDLQEICHNLFQALAQIDDQEQAKEFAECAGIDLD